MTENTENSFPFNQFAPDHFSDDKIDTMLAVINGLQRNLMMIAQKIDVIEHRLNELEKEHDEQIRRIQQAGLPL